MNNFPIGVIVDSFRLPIYNAVKKAAEVGADGIQVYASNGEMALYEFLSQLLSYGTYCIVGVLAVMGKVPLEVGIQGIALSGNFYGALKSSFLLWPKLAVAKVAEERLTQLFASENREEEIEGNEITLENVSFSYNREILKDASFSMDHRAKILLRGANGAGKSTTLKMIAGILKPTRGSIIFNKHPWKRSDLSNIGALIETPPLYGNLTARENLKVRTELLNISDGRIDEVLEISGLTGTGKKRAGQFSMGMKQRLGIAIALLNNPKLLILDEPTNGLDPVGIEELRNLIRQFPKQGMTVILSSHILSEVEQIADYIGIICNGKLEYEAPENKEDNLEALFMDIVKRNRREII